MRSISRVKASLVALAGFSLFLLFNYQSVAPADFFGTYIGSIVIFGTSINHEFVGVGMLLSVIFLPVPTGGRNYGCLISFIAGAILIVSDLPGLTTTAISSAVLSIAVGLVYFLIFYALFYTKKTAKVGGT